MGEDHGSYYGHVIWYCQATGSTELEAYYLTAFQQKFPDLAERMFPSLGN